MTKSVSISSSGLKNIVLNNYQENDDFTFIFGDQQIRMKSFFAEFISPIVSNIHKTDPTINYANFNEIIKSNNNNFNNLSKSLLTPDIITHLLQVSSGYSIEVNDEQALKLRMLSIILGNEELHTQINELFPQNYEEENVNIYIQNLENFYYFSDITSEFDISNTIKFISSHFYAIDCDEFFKLPRRFQYMIVSHKDLQIESEDSLYDVIIQILKQPKEKEEEIEDILFLEEIEFRGLSEVKFQSFLDEFDINDLSVQLWRNICQCFFSHSLKIRKHSIKENPKKFIEIIVAGYDESCQLGQMPNNVNEEGYSIISPPSTLSFEPSSLLSYSIYGWHSVLVTSDGLLKGVGCNEDGQITSSLQKAVIEHFTEFSINDKSGRKLDPISAVCSLYGTLIMLSNADENGRQLVLFDENINKDEPVFLDIGEVTPVALFGGCSHSAVICSDGRIIFINLSSIRNSPDSRIEAVSLPDGEKASSIACCNESVIVLSSNGRVFESPVEERSCALSFNEVVELKGNEFVWISGTSIHCLAVRKDGRVFCRGSNSYGQLGIGKDIESVSEFREISSLSGYKIRAAYAGGSHSLFETSKGEILSCGSNSDGQLLLRTGIGEYIYSPAETAITEGATFCIAGNGLSSVFIGRNPPPNTPNIPIHQYE